MIPKVAFEHTNIQPRAVRGMLRTVMMPGERLVGWGVVRGNSGFLSQLGQAAAALVPGIGALLAVGLMRGDVRFCVLTDTRLILLAASPRGGRLGLRHVLLHEPLTAIGVHALGGWRFAMTSPRWVGPRVFSVFGGKRPAGRLAAGLGILAEHPVRAETRAMLRERRVAEA